MASMRYLFAIVTTLALADQPAHSRSEYRLGGEDGHPWQEVLSGGGVYLNFDSQNRIARQVQVGVTPYGDPVARMADTGYLLHSTNHYMLG